MQQQTNAQAHTLDSLKQALVTHRPGLPPLRWTPNCLS